MIFTIINYIVAAIVILISSIYLHERGHIMMLKIYNYRYSYHYKKGLRFEVKCDDIFITKREDQNVLLGGIVLGLVPIELALLLGYNPFSYICLLGIYILLCHEDIKRLFNINRGKNEKEI